MNPLLHNPTKAAKILCVDLATVTGDVLSAAFRTAVRKAHPDFGGDAGYTIAQLQDARESVKKYLEQRGR